jgi:tryptophanyl-tRNA synthetase
MTDYNSGSLRYSDLKETTANALIAMIAPFRTRLEELNANKKIVKEQIQDSSAVIRQRAQRTMKEVRELTGLASLRG